MRLAIMQPYFMPYIGYFQLINAADLFIVYDNIKYTKKGWINRNRILRNGASATISLPLRADSDALDVVERRLSDGFNPNKLLAQIAGSYRTAPQFKLVMPLLDEILHWPELNLFQFNLHSIRRTCEFLNIETPIRASSSFSADHSLRAQARVLALCEAATADTYINPIGGVDLYEKSDFAAHGVTLRFLRSLPFSYAQLASSFVPWLSIIDVIMFNSRDVVSERLRCGWQYE